MTDVPDNLTTWIPSVLAFVAVVLVWIGIAILTGSLAERRGREDGLWYLFGFVLGPVALLVLLLLPVVPRVEEPPVHPPGMRPCPHCAQDIDEAATVCRFCGHMLEVPHGGAA